MLYYVYVKRRSFQNPDNEETIKIIKRVFTVYSQVLHARGKNYFKCSIQNYCNVDTPNSVPMVFTTFEESIRLIFILFTALGID